MLKERLRSVGVVIGRALTAVGLPLPEPVFRHLHFVGPFDLALPNGSTMRLNSWGSRVENELAWRGWDGHEGAERARWLEVVSGGGDIFDVGANTGTYALMAKAVSPESQVVAFEPVPRIADMAETNIGVSGLRIEIVRAAVSEEAGQAPIYDPGGENAYSASLESDFLNGEKRVYNVPVVTIDGYCNEHGLDPSAIKIDVEGSEGRVLLGARELISRRRATFLCEWLGSSDSHRDAIRLLDEYGYSAIDIQTLADFDLASHRGYEDRNVLIAPRETISRYKKIWVPL